MTSYNNSYYKPGFGLSMGSKWTRAIMILIIANVSIFIVQLLFSSINSQWGGGISGKWFRWYDPSVKFGYRSIYNYFLALPTIRYREVMVMAICNIYVSA